jgi:flavodoxin
VACFSATGNTRPIAKAAAQALNADYFEIEPTEPYTDKDLDYHDTSTRATEEQNGPETRPALVSTPDFSAYDVMLIGHPIWWGKAPRLICTFLESGDVSGKSLAEFCTSGSSGIEEANAELKELAPNANWIGAHRFAAGASDEEVTAWTSSLNIA